MSAFEILFAIFEIIANAVIIAILLKNRGKENRK